MEFPHLRVSGRAPSVTFLPCDPGLRQARLGFDDVSGQTLQGPGIPTAVPKKKMQEFTATTLKRSYASCYLV